MTTTCAHIPMVVRPNALSGFGTGARARIRPTG
jgi:hypothetical protein